MRGFQRRNRAKGTTKRVLSSTGRDSPSTVRGADFGDFSLNFIKIITNILKFYILMPKLISVSGHTLNLPQPPCRVGTESTCNVPMQAGLGIAGHHLTILQDADGSYLVEDGGSGFGTFINGSPVTRSALRDGDSLRFGQIELTFETSDEMPKESEGEPAESKKEASSEMPVVEERPAATPSEKIAEDDRILPDLALGDDKILADSQAAATHSPIKLPPSLSGDAKRRRSSGRHKAKRSSEKKRSVGLMLVGALGMAVSAFGYLQWQIVENEQSRSVVIIPASVTSERAAALQTPNNLMLKTAKTLGGLTRPVAVVSLDLRALREKGQDLQEALPRLKAWCFRYLKMDLNDIKHVVAMGMSADEFALGIVLQEAVDDARIQEAEAAGDLEFETLQGTLVARLVDPELIIVTQPGRLPADREPVETPPLPKEVRGHLLHADGKLISYYDGLRADRGSLPFFLSDPGSDLKTKVAVLDFDEMRLALHVSYSEAGLARPYAKRFGSSISRALLELTPEDQQSLIDSAVASISASADEENARIQWQFGEAKTILFRGLVEMIGDPLGAEVAPAPEESLRREAEHAAALFHTAREAGADVGEIENVDGALLALSRGLEGSLPEWNERVFRSRPYAKKERLVMERFLTFADGELTYHQEEAPAVSADQVPPALLERLPEGSAESNAALKAKYLREAADLAARYNDSRAEGAPAFEEEDVSFEAAVDRLLEDGSLSEDEKASVKYFLRMEDGLLVTSDSDYE